jgi:hypothetical protein
LRGDLGCIAQMLEVLGFLIVQATDPSDWASGFPLGSRLVSSSAAGYNLPTFWEMSKVDKWWIKCW